MKNQLTRWLIAILLLLTVVPAEARRKSDAEKWAQRGEWRNGFAPSPHSTTDFEEFRSQYKKNKELWDKLFTWLATNDLLSMPAGVYEIDGKRCYVKVSDPKTRDESKSKVESHRQYVDFQYVAKGNERFGRIAAENATPIAPYKPDVIHYTATHIDYMDSDPETFFLFFPRNLHIAMIKTDEEPEQIRLIVAKIEYAE